ncbi:MAG: hypothetical protein GX354_04400 [Firmicutes bacterium]|nr:hypothetical protein [Bacillota bacterium]
MAFEINLEESYELKGYWWLPSNPQTTILGTLNLESRQGIYLHLEGNLQGNLEQQDLGNSEIVLGRTYKGQDITLWNCSRMRQITRLTFNFVGIQSRYRCQAAYIGQHFPVSHEIKFSVAEIWLHHLDEWVNRSGFVLPRPGSTEIRIEYNPPQPIKLYRDSQTTVTVEFSTSAPTYELVQKSVHMTQSSFLKITNDEPQCLDDYLDTNKMICSLIALAVRGPVYPTRIRLKADNKSSNPVSAYFALEDRKGSRIKLPPEMVLSFSQITDRVESIFRTWCNKWSLMKPIYAIYHGDVHGRDLYLEQKFLGMTQALESYHRRFIGGQYQSEDEYMETVYPNLVRAIPCNICPSYRDSLRDKMKHMYEYSLRKRLGELISLAPEAVTIRLLGDKTTDKNQFIENVVCTRNYFTHYTQELEAKAIRGPALYWLYNKMKILCEIMFFQEMGFELTEIDTFILENCEYDQELEMGLRATS